MTTSALSGTIDYLLTNFATVVTNVDPNGVVYESWVANAPPPPAPILVVGGQRPDDVLTADEVRQYVTLGAGHVEEQFKIPCFIDVFVTTLDQSVPRKIACQVFDGVVDLVRSDLTLGGNLLRGRFAELTDIVLVGTRDEEEAETGRRAVLSFVVGARNLY